MTYVDGYVLPVPKHGRDAYLKMAKEVSAVFKKHGALKVVECWGDDVPEGKVTSFPKAVKCEPEETVVFSWIVWPSKEARDKGMKAVREEPLWQGPTEDLPFDGKRMIFGGFETILDV